MSIISKIICIFAPKFSNLLKISIIMVNKALLVNLFRYCLDNCNGNYLSFEIPSSKLDDLLSLVRITGASWEITSIHGDSDEDFVTLLISDF